MRKIDLVAHSMGGLVAVNTSIFRLRNDVDQLIFWGRRIWEEAKHISLGKVDSLDQQN